MSTEWFLKLKEFDSLSKMKLASLKAIKEQADRLSTLNQRRQEQLDRAEQLKHELFTSNQNYFESEKKLKSSEEQASRLRDIGGDETKIKSYQKEAMDLEDHLFVLLEQSESIQLESKENAQFLLGLEKTIKDIAHEVEMEVKAKQKEIEHAELRLKFIQDELPDNFKDLLKRTLARNLAVGIFTRNEQGSCYFCRYKISKVDESEIDMQHLLKICPQCYRIFLPYGS